MIRRKIATISLMLIGICLLVYPVVATFMGNLNGVEIAREQIHEMNKKTEEGGKAEQEEKLQAARDYNSNILGVPILDPYLHRMTDQGTEEYQTYLSILHDSKDGIMGRLIVPKGKIDLPIRHGTDDDSIARGVGHLFGTGMPVGGKGNNSVLTAHSGLTTMSLFDGLRDVKIGDFIYVQTEGETLAWKVREINVIDPYQLDLFKPKEDEDLVTLFTCTPYGVNTHRLVVTGERVALEDTPREDLKEPTWVNAFRVWMIAPPIIITVTIATATIIVKRNKKRANSEEVNEDNRTCDGKHSFVGSN